MWRSKVGKVYKINSDLDRSDSISLPNSEIVELCGNFVVRASQIWDFKNCLVIWVERTDD